MTESQSRNLGAAVVTGASSGIGKVYADRLAARGYDLVLVARRAERLHQIAIDLQERYSIRAEVLVADLTQPAGLSSAIEKISSDPSISFLVNNAGFSAAKPLSETSTALLTSMIALNITALTALSKAALTRFQEQGFGAIVNIGSGVGFGPMSTIPVYGPTKAYVLQFTQILQQTVEGTGVRVQLVTPGAIVTEGWEVAGLSMDSMDPAVFMTAEDCVDAAFAGFDKGELITAPSLEDDTLLRKYEDSASEVLQAMFDGRTATRYRVTK
uniref:Short-chain dehydrogenase/reductase SDR n=1 Tax=Caulobacter sp. (strain K31) TaxID=366602 RepID=B0T6M9_CAUSK